MGGLGVMTMGSSWHSILDRLFLPNLDFHESKHTSILHNHSK